MVSDHVKWVRIGAEHAAAGPPLQAETGRAAAAKTSMRLPVADRGQA